MNQALLSQRARAAYQTTQVENDHPLGLIVKLYDGMLAYLRRGADALAVRDFNGAADPIRRATDIVGELQAVLDIEKGGDVAVNLDRIYSYCRRRIMEAHLHTDAAGLIEVADLLQPLRDAWDEARVKQGAQGA